MKTKLKRINSSVIISLTVAMSQLSQATETINLEKFENDTLTKTITKNCMGEILKTASIDQIKDQESLTNLKLVCKKWYELIHQLIKKDRPVASPFYKPFYGISGVNEAIFERFLKGVLIYKPNTHNDEGRVELRICDLKNPLEGTFDLSKCGDTGKYLSINTGYKKGKNPENANKVEIWIAPRFLIESKLDTTAKNFKPIMNNNIDNNWKQEQAPVGMFWTWGGWDDDWYDHLTTENMDDLSQINLYENWQKRCVKRAAWRDRGVEMRYRRACASGECGGQSFIFHL